MLSFYKFCAMVQDLDNGLATEWKHLQNSSVQKILIRDKTVYIKRDDLLHPVFNGNKARKFYSILNTPQPGITSLISHGGHQSNAMYSLSHLCRMNKWEFHYYTKPLPAYLRQNPQGNYTEALNAGMQLHEITHLDYTQTIESLRTHTPANTLFVAQGGAERFAKEGVELLAGEINAYVEQNGLEHVVVVLSSGAGTTALCLMDALHPKIELLTIPCVGDGDCLRAQIRLLEPGRTSFPLMLETQEKIPFGAPDPKLLEVYHELMDSGIEFDLLYDCKAWLALFENWERFRERTLLFIHTGGTHGNPSMLARYAQLGLWPY